MAKCQRSTIRGKGGVSCRRNAAPGSRYCTKHGGSAMASRSRSRSSRTRSRRGGGDSCGLFVVAFLLAVAALVGVLV